LRVSAVSLFGFGAGGVGGELGRTRRGSGGLSGSA
jgi:hypothetical protein